LHFSIPKSLKAQPFFTVNLPKMGNTAKKDKKLKLIKLQIILLWE